MARIPEGSLNVDPEISDKDLDLALYKHLVEIEGQLLAEGHDIMVPEQGDNYGEYRKRLQDYLSKAEDIKRSISQTTFHTGKSSLICLSWQFESKPDDSYVRED